MKSRQSVTQSSAPSTQEPQAQNRAPRGNRFQQERLGAQPSGRGANSPMQIGMLASLGEEERPLGALRAAFGSGVDRIQIHEGKDAANTRIGALAHAKGNDVHLSSAVTMEADDVDSMEILGHEVAHALAGGGSGETELDKKGDPGEEKADQMGVQFRKWAERDFEGAAPKLGAATGGRAKTHRWEALDSALEAGSEMVDDAAWELGLTDGWWVQFRAVNDWTARKEMVETALKAGTMDELIDSLPAEQRYGDYLKEYGLVLDFIQQASTVASAGKTIPELGVAEQSYLDAKELAIAQQVTGNQTVTTEQKEQAHAGLMEPTYAAPAEPGTLIWPTLSDDKRKEWEARGAAAAARYIAYHQANVHDYPITEGQMVFDGETCEALNGYAYAKDGKCYFGMEIVEAIEKNPAYAVSTVIHELFGHPTEAQGYQVGERVFAKGKGATTGTTGAIQLSKDEWTRFHYYESEISALVYEYGYYVSAKDTEPANSVVGPEALMPELLRDFYTQWAPTVLKPLLQGLYDRFRFDANLKSGAADWFKEEVKTTLTIDLGAP